MMLSRRHLIAGLMLWPTLAGAAGTGIAIVSRERVLRESKAAQALQDIERAMTAELQASIDAARAELDAEEADLTRLRAELPPEEFEIRAAAYDRRIREVRRVAQERAGLLQRGFQEARARLVATLPEILEKLRVERGLSVILDGDRALAVAPDADLTDAAIALLNSDDRAIEIPLIDLSTPLLPPAEDAGAAPAPEAQQ